MMRGGAGAGLIPVNPRGGRGAQYGEDMSLRNLDALFAPRAIVLVGASDAPRSVGATVMRNLIAGGFAGAIHPVNPKHRQVAGRPCYVRVADLPDRPDLAVVCTPAATVPRVVEELGQAGARAAVVMSAGLDRTQKDSMLAAAKPNLLRVLGPNGMGLIVPALGINASFAHRGAPPGRIAFVSQSGALMTAVLDWAVTRGIGFSKIVSLGEGADVDCGDVLDYLAGDPETGAILLYLEAVTAARKFMSAARAAARNKPVIVVKSGRVPEGARAAFSHSGALAGADAVYDAAIRRAGMLRVDTTEALFDAVETLARSKPPPGDRLAIVTNGGGPGVMAADALVEQGGRLATLSEATLARLDAVLPPTWSRANPIDVIGDAPVERYVDTLAALADTRDADAVLLLHAPTAIVPSAEIAASVVAHAEAIRRPLLTCWIGGDGVGAARGACERAELPTFDTPEGAVRAFLQMVDYARNQAMLTRVPPAPVHDVSPDASAARELVRAAVASGRDTLDPAQSLALLRAFGVPVAEAQVAPDVDRAVEAATRIGFPVALKIVSAQISHKSDVGGVRLALPSAQGVRDAASEMLSRACAMRPDATVDGFLVQRMVRREGALELLAGLADDPVFGPVVVFGQGGTVAERVADRALALAPLDDFLARDLIGRTRVAKLLDAFRDRPAADVDALVKTLVALSRLAADCPEVVELDINPLLASDLGVLALDARVRLDPSRRGAERFSILPYPQQLGRAVEWRGETIGVRPIRPDDAEAHLAFFDALEADDVRNRMFIRLRELPRSQLARLTQIDYDREMAFIATRDRPDGGPETLGVVRALADPDNVQAEFAIIVRSDLKRHGLGRLLLERMIEYLRARGTQRVVGETLVDNAGMRDLARSLGFALSFDATHGTTRLSRELR